MTPVGTDGVVGERFGDPIGVEGSDRKFFVLRRSVCLREELARSGLQDATLRRRAPDGLEQPHDAQAGVLSRQDRLSPGGWNDALSAKVEYPLGPNLLEDRQQRILIQQVARDGAIGQRGVPGDAPDRRLAHDAPDGVAARGELFGDVKTELASDAGDEGSAHLNHRPQLVALFSGPLPYV